MAGSFKALVIPPAVARGVITRHHYSRAWPTGNFVSFGAFLDEKLVGVCTYGHPANKNAASSIPGCSANRSLCELTRLWIADWAPRFMESRLIGATLRLLRRDSVARVALSYADPAHGHTGAIYQASNWIYLGQMAPSQQLRFSDGTLMHKRAAFDRFGTDNPARLRSVDPGIRSASVPGKHKYLYPIDSTLRPALLRMAVAFPRRPVEGSGDHPEMGGSNPTSTLHREAGIAPGEGALDG